MIRVKFSGFVDIDEKGREITGTDMIEYVTFHIEQRGGIRGKNPLVNDNFQAEITEIDTRGRRR